MSDAKEIKSAVSITFFEFSDGRTGVDIVPNPDELPDGPAKEAARAFESMLESHGWKNTIRTTKQTAPTLRLAGSDEGSPHEH